MVLPKVWLRAVVGQPGPAVLGFTADTCGVEYTGCMGLHCLSPAQLHGTPGVQLLHSLGLTQLVQNRQGANEGFLICSTDYTISAAAGLGWPNAAAALVT